jgi:hypothetical protein
MSVKQTSTVERKAAGRKPKDAKPPKDAGTKPDTRPRATVVAAIREKVEQRLEKNVNKASLADYIRLMQLEKELQNTEAKETKATWVEPKGTEQSDSGK